MNVLITVLLLLLLIALMVCIILFTSASKKYTIYNKETGNTIATIYIQGNHVEVKGAGRPYVVLKEEDTW